MKNQRVTRVLAIGVLTVSLFSAAFGQTSQRYEKYLGKYNYELGYIETLRGQRIEGLIRSPHGLRAHAKVVFVSKGGNKKMFYPSELSAYGTDYEQYESDGDRFLKMVTRSNGIGLYALSVNGSWSASGPYGAAPMMYGASYTSYYVKRLSELDFVEVKKKRFQETFSEYFYDCPDVQSKIASKEFTHKNVEEMIKYYQYSCRRQEAIIMKGDRF